MMEETIRVMVIDDHPVVREGIVDLLETVGNIQVVGAFRTADEAVRAFDSLRPDVTLVDLQLPGMRGVQAIQTIRRRSPAARFVVLTTYDGDEDIYRAFQAGAKAYLLKDMFLDQIIDTVRAVHAGKTRVPDAVAERLLERVQSQELTVREVQVLQMIAEGAANRTIADRLKVSESTVKVHVQHLLEKLSVPDRTAAAMTALQRGIIHL
jgi:DNA-binding NarL/FixJ family response regulator